MSFINLTKHNGANSVDVAMAANGNNRLLVVVTQQIRNPVTLAGVRVNGAAGGTTLVSTNTDDPNTVGVITYFVDSELPSSAGTYAVEPADSGGGATDGSMQIYYAENADQSPLIASSLGAFANPSGQTRTASLGATAADLQVAAYSGNAPTAVVGVIDYAGGGGTHFISAQSDSDIEFTTNYIASASIAASFASISAASNQDPSNDSAGPDTLIDTNGTGSYDHAADFSDPDSDPLTFSANPALPAGMSMTNAGLRSWSGIIAAAPTLHDIIATDGNGGTDAVDRIVVGVAPDGTSWITDTVAATTGIYAEAEFAGVAVNDVAYAYWETGSGVFDPTNGAVQSDDGGVLKIWFHDVSDPDIATALDATPFTVNVPASIVTADVGQIPLTIQAGWNKTDLVDPVTTEGSVLEGYSGDDPVTGDDLEWRVTSTLDSGVTFDVLATGEFEVTEATPGDWVTDIVIERRVVQSDGTIGSTANFTADATPPAQSNTPTTGLPVITGTAQVGQQLGVDTSALADVDGLGTFTYSWRLDGSEVGTEATYTPNATGSLLVRVSHTDGGGTVETVPSAAVTVQAAPAVNNPPTGLPVILGTPQAGQTLSIDTSAISDADGLGTFSQVWRKDGVSLGVTDGTYVPLAGDVGSVITVAVAYTDGEGNSEGPLVSAGVTITAAPSVDPTISPVINSKGSEVVSVFSNQTFADPNWTWGDDVVDNQAVSWSGDEVTSTPGLYTRTATATNSVGTVTLDCMILVNEIPRPSGGKAIMKEIFKSVFWSRS